MKFSIHTGSLQKANRPLQKGIALYVAIAVTGALLLVSYAIIEFALKEVAISSAGRDSQEAFYAADSGDECAVYWDIKNPTNPGTSAFATSTVQSITCNADAANVANIVVIPFHVNNAEGTIGTSTFKLLFLPNTYCAFVSVVKDNRGASMKTIIESKGYNTCASSPNRIERAIRIKY